MRVWIVFLCAVVALTSTSAAAAARPLRTALLDPFVLYGGSDLEPGLDRAATTGATAVMYAVDWRTTAPRGEEVAVPPGEPRKWAPPAGFDPTNPADPRYDWSATDTFVRRAAAHGLEPMLTLMWAPLWAEDADSSIKARSSWYVDPRQFGELALAAARRYSGSFEGLPRVRSWQVWNEPNAASLGPQVTTAPTGQRIAPETVLSADSYRDLVNAFATAVHSVHSDNVVVAGSLSPFTNSVGILTIGPLVFMRKVLCLAPTGPPTRVCDKTIQFDAWSIHPYTSGGPNHHAFLPDDVSIGDLPKMKALLDAAVAAKVVVSSGQVSFWVTEFSWDSNPPDPKAAPVGVLPRWVAEGLYRMWQSGVSLVTWFLLRDAPQTTLYQSGLYYRGSSFQQDRPKPLLAAFRFPFVAFPAARARISVWGRTPAGRAAVVLVQQQSGGTWKKLGVVRTDGNGIFQARLPQRGKGLFVRASTFTGARAVPFSLHRTQDMPVSPFGGIPSPALEW